MTAATAILGLLALYLIVSPNGKWHYAALATVVVGFTRDRVGIQAVGGTGGQAIKFDHQCLPLLAVRLYPTIELIGEQVADLMGHDLLDKDLRVFREQDRVKPEFVDL